MKARLIFFCAAAAAAVLAACGGGGGGGGGGVITPTNPPVTATPIQTPTTAPPNGDVTFGGAPTSAPLPSNALGATGTVSLPAGSGTVAYSYSSTPPPSGPNQIQARVRNVAATSNTGLLYLTFTASGAVTLNGVPGFTATLPSSVTSSIPAGSTFFVAYYGSQTGQTPAAQSPAWVSSNSGASLVGSTLTIPAATTPTFTLTSGQSVYFVLYYGYYIPVNNQNGCVGVQPDTAARAQVVGVNPPTFGSSWNYTGTLTDTIVRSSPCPIPTASSAAAVTVTVTIAPTTQPGAAYPGNGQYVDEHSVESDAYATNTTQVTTDATVNGAAEAYETSVDLTGNTVVTSYAAGVSYHPPSSQNDYTNVPPTTVNTTFADGTTYDRTYTSNGAYTETDTLAGVTPQNTIQTNADGSASYTAYNGYYGESLAFAMSAPSSGNITFTLTQPGASPQPITVPAWFQANPTLYNDYTTQTTVTSLPVSCAGSHGTLFGAGSSATDYNRKISTLDPALGSTEVLTTDSYYVTNYTGSTTVGPVCVVINDVQNLYYDFLFDTPYLVYVSGNGQPIQTDTLNETFYFSSAPVGETSVRPQDGAAAAANLALHESGFAFIRAIQRAQRIEKFARALSSGQFKGVVR